MAADNNDGNKSTIMADQEKAAATSMEVATPMEVEKDVTGESNKDTREKDTREKDSREKDSREKDSREKDTLSDNNANELAGQMVAGRAAAAAGPGGIIGREGSHGAGRLGRTGRSRSQVASGTSRTSSVNISARDEGDDGDDGDERDGMESMDVDEGMDEREGDSGSKRASRTPERNEKGKNRKNSKTADSPGALSSLTSPSPIRPRTTSKSSSASSNGSKNGEISEEDDEILAEIDVFVDDLQDPTAFQADFACVQFPTRPHYRPYNNASGPSNSSSSPATPSSSSSGQALSSVQFQPAYKLPRFGYNLDKTCPQGGSFNHQSRFARMEKMWLKGNRIENDYVDYAVGVLRQGKMYITPLDIVAQMRPDLSHVDNPSGESQIHVANSSSSAADKEKQQFDDMFGDNSAKQSVEIRAGEPILPVGGDEENDPSAGEAWLNLPFYKEDTGEAAEIYENYMLHNQNPRWAKHDYPAPMNVADFDPERDSWISVHDLEAKSLSQKSTNLIQTGIDELRKRGEEKRAGGKRTGGGKRKGKTGQDSLDAIPSTSSSEEESDEESDDGDSMKDGSGEKNNSRSHRRTQNDARAEAELNRFLAQDEEEAMRSSSRSSTATSRLSTVTQPHSAQSPSQAEWYLRQLCQTSVLEGGDAAIAALMSGSGASGPALQTGEPPKKGPGGETIAADSSSSSSGAPGVPTSGRVSTSGNSGGTDGADGSGGDGAQNTSQVSLSRVPICMQSYVYPEMHTKTASSSLVNVHDLSKLTIREQFETLLRAHGQAALPAGFHKILRHLLPPKTQHILEHVDLVFGHKTKQDCTRISQDEAKQYCLSQYCVLAGALIAKNSAEHYGNWVLKSEYLPYPPEEQLARDVLLALFIQGRRCDLSQWQTLQYPLESSKRIKEEMIGQEEIDEANKRYGTLRFYDSPDKEFPPALLAQYKPLGQKFRVEVMQKYGDIQKQLALQAQKNPQAGRPMVPVNLNQHVVLKWGFEIKSLLLERALPESIVQQMLQKCNKHRRISRELVRTVIEYWNRRKNDESIARQCQRDSMVMSYRKWMGAREAQSKKILEETEKRWGRRLEASDSNESSRESQPSGDDDSNGTSTSKGTFSVQENLAFIHVCNQVTQYENVLCHPNHLLDREGKLLPVLSKIQIQVEGEGHEGGDGDMAALESSNTLSPEPLGNSNPVWYLTHIYGMNRALTASFKESQSKADESGNQSSNPSPLSPLSPLRLTKRIQLQPAYYFDWRMSLLRTAVVDYFTRNPSGNIEEIRNHCAGFVKGEIGRLEEEKATRDEENGMFNVQGGFDQGGFDQGGFDQGGFNKTGLGNLALSNLATADPDLEEFGIPLIVLTAAGLDVDKATGSVTAAKTESGMAVGEKSGNKKPENSKENTRKIPQFLKHLAKSKRWSSPVDPTPLPRRSAERIMRDTTIYELRKLVSEFADMDLATREFHFIGMLDV